MDMKMKNSTFVYFQVYICLFQCELLLYVSANSALNQGDDRINVSTIVNKSTEAASPLPTTGNPLQTHSSNRNSLVNKAETTRAGSSDEFQTSKTLQEFSTNVAGELSTTVPTLDTHINVSSSHLQTTNGRPLTTDISRINPTTPSFVVRPTTTPSIVRPTEFITFYYELITAAPTVLVYQPTLSMMEDLMNAKAITKYLDTFMNDMQITIVGNQLKHCPYQSLCTFDSIAEPAMYSCCSQCSCDISTCGLTGDCCPSIIPSEDFKISNDTRDNNGLSINEDDLSDLTCIPFILSHHTEEGFLANVKCPRGASEELNDLCTKMYSNLSKLVDIVPVYSNSSGSVYRNRYCAICNDIPTKDIVSFGTSFACLEELMFDSVLTIQDAITISLASYDCDIEFINFDIEIQRCDYSIDKCNVSGYWQTYDPIIESACGMYTSKVYYFGAYYRNIHCALCNEIVPFVTCGGDSSVKTSNFGFSGLLALDNKQAILSTEAPTIKDSKSSCGNNQMFDVLFEKCRDLHCPGKSFPSNGACASMFSAVSDSMMYFVEMQLLPMSTISVLDAFDIQYLLLNTVIDRVKYMNILDLCNIQLIYKTDLKYSKLKNTHNVNPRVFYVEVKIEILKGSFGTLQNPSSFADKILSDRLRPLVVNTSAGIPMEFQMVYTQLDSKLLNVVNLFGQSQTFRYPFSRKNNTEKLRILLNYSLPDIDGLTYIPNIDNYYTGRCAGQTAKEISILKYSSCPKVLVSAGDIKWTDALDGIVVDDLKIDRSLFYYTDDMDIMMCVEEYKKLVQHLLPERSLTPEIIVSIVCNSLSILALLITIITIVILPKLRNSLPGHNNLCLSLSLMIAQILYLVGTVGIFDQYSLPCKTVALLIHFSWLYVVFWMNVCTYHLYITLTRTEVHSRKFDVKKSLFYHLYVFTFSLLFVGLNILISFLHSTGVGYGGKFCYITSGERILISFVSPTILIVLANLVMFLFVICRVTKSSGIRKSVKNDRNDLIILTKLATLTGISWVFGFLYIWTEMSVLSYIFIVLNAGQGVFIMISFVLNGRVLEMLKDRFKGNAEQTTNSNSADQKDKQPVTSSTMM